MKQSDEYDLNMWVNDINAAFSMDEVPKVYLEISGNKLERIGDTWKSISDGAKVQLLLNSGMMIDLISFLFRLTDEYQRKYGIDLNLLATIKALIAEYETKNRM